MSIFNQRKLEHKSFVFLLQLGAVEILVGSLAKIEASVSSSSTQNTTTE